MARQQTQRPADGRVAAGASDPFDAVVSEIGFVVRREPYAHWNYRAKSNDDWHILAVASAGRASYACRGRTFTVQEGQVLFFPRGTPHAGRSDPNKPWAFYAVGFDLRCGRAAADAVARLPALIDPPNAQEVVSIFQQLERAWVDGEPGYGMYCRALTQQVLATAIATTQGQLPQVPHARRIASIMRMMQRDPGRRYSVDELAAMADLSPSRFRLLFQKVAGQSVVRYQNGLRIHRAKNLLLSGQCTVTEAAEQTGFSDVYYFSRLFKKTTGRNPSAFGRR